MWVFFGINCPFVIAKYKISCSTDHFFCNKFTLKRVSRVGFVFTVTKIAHCLVLITKRSPKEWTFWRYGISLKFTLDKLSVSSEAISSHVPALRFVAMLPQWQKSFFLGYSPTYYSKKKNNKYVHFYELNVEILHLSESGCVMHGQGPNLFVSPDYVRLIFTGHCARGCREEKSTWVSVL